LGIRLFWPDSVSTQYELVKIEDKEASTTDQVQLPSEIKTTSQAVQYLMQNHGMTEEENHGKS